MWIHFSPQQLSSKSRSGRSLDEEPEEEGERQRRGPFFSWSRARSTGRSQKKKELGDHSHPHGWCCPQLSPLRHQPLLCVSSTLLGPQPGQI